MRLPNRFLPSIMMLASHFVTLASNAQPYEVPKKLDSSIRFNTVAAGEHEINYAYSGDQSKPGVIFIHGTPGGWGAFNVYLSNSNLQNEFFMISVNRLGWGLSAIPNKEIDGDFKKQASAIIKIFEQYPNKQWTIVGHSLGASIAPKVAIIEPDKVKAMLLLAGSLDPKLGSPRWYNRAASTWLVRLFLPSHLNNSNKEIMRLRSELKIMASEISQIQFNTRLAVMQGGTDKLVSPKNTKFVDKQWRNNFSEVTLVELPDEGHFLPWRQTDFVAHLIKALQVDGGVAKLLSERSKKALEKSPEALHENKPEALHENKPEALHENKPEALHENKFKALE